jgi:NAD(P)-dependent dehydrogenase (short-subunit alcohol dehydrogenase family)
MGRLTGRTVLITGSTGIGGATAERAVREGARVFVVSRTAAHAQTLGERIGAGWAGADLAEEAEVDAAVSAAVDHLGRIDGCVSVVGGSGRRFGDGRIDTMTAEAWESTERLNLRTQVLTCARVIRAMREQPANDGGTRGSLVLIGSALATSPVPELFATHGYAATKGAVAALMTSMAATYLDDRIRVNLVAPSLTRTPMADRAANDAHILEYAARKQPLAGEMLDPVEVANAALFFLSDESRTVTGQHLAVDGGWSLVSTTAVPVR